MRVVLNAKQMKAVDSYMINDKKIPGLLLMENAAMGVCDIIMEQTDPCTVLVVCGTGNNGGDGLAVARILLVRGYDVYVVVAGEKQAMTDDTKANFGLFECLEDRVKCISNMDELENWDMPQAQVVVDALLGTGITRDVEGLYRELIGYINRQDALVISVDIPSGINADTGALMGAAVEASVTATFQYPKIGHYLFPGREYTGVLEVVPIGIDDGCDVLKDTKVCVYESQDADICLSKRRANSNKGDYGRLLLIAGSVGMAGAAVLSARAATRAGAGLVTVGAPEDVVRVVQNNVPEATCKILPEENGGLERRSIFELGRIVNGKSAIAAGPGLGTSGDIQELVLHLITNYAITKVIDADGINVLAGKLELLLKKEGEIILTPHPKEFARMTDMTVGEVLKNPIGIAAAFAKEFGVTLVLKGATTVVADKNGKVALVCAGTPGMAKGGSGDVLTGIIAGFAAQGKQPFESALLGVYIAANAGEIAADEMGEYAMTPMDAVNCIPDAIQEVTSDLEVFHDAAAEYEYTEEGQVQAVEENNTLPEQHETAPETEKVSEDTQKVKTVSRTEATLITEKTAEDALAEIEAKEQTQEIKKDILNGLQNMDDPDKPDGPTRRRIG